VLVQPLRPGVALLHPGPPPPAYPVPHPLRPDLTSASSAAAAAAAAGDETLAPHRTAPHAPPHCRYIRYTTRQAYAMLRGGWRGSARVGRWDFYSRLLPVE
jgi:hypothetical protein